MVKDDVRKDTKFHRQTSIMANNCKLVTTKYIKYNYKQQSTTPMLHIKK